MGFFRLIYGLLLGTSVQYIKPQKRYLFPTGVVDIHDHLDLFMGGSGICGVLQNSGKEVFLINVNQREAGEKLQKYLGEKSLTVKAVAITNAFDDYLGSLSLYSSENPLLYVPQTSTDSKFKKFIVESGVNLAPVENGKTILWGDETVKFLTFQNAYSTEDLVVVLESSKLVFTGGLFFNEIHPVLREEDLGDVGNWISALETLARNFPDHTFVPAEGDLASARDLGKMTGYLKCLSEKNAEFSICRQNYDWREIPSHTTLEENFDILQGKRGSYLKL